MKRVETSIVPKNNDNNNGWGGTRWWHDQYKNGAIMWDEMNSDLAKQFLSSMDEYFAANPVKTRQELLNEIEDILKEDKK